MITPIQRQPPAAVKTGFRTEGPRIAIYSWAQGQRVSDARVADALVDMARHPGKYQTRYTKLAGKQRIVFKAIGPVVGVEFSERLAGGEAFYTYCEQVRMKLKDWVNSLPEAALKITELTDTQRKLLRTLRGPVPPQLPLLADGLVEFAAEDSGTHEELAGTGTAAAFPAIASAWRALREKIERHIEGVKVPVRTAVRTLIGEPDSEEPVTTSKLAEVIRSVSDVVAGPGSRFQQIADQLDHEDYPDPAVALPAVLAGKPAESLTDEDFGRARGVVEVAVTLREQQRQQQAAGQYVVLLPSGQRRNLSPLTEPGAADRIAADIQRWRDQTGLTADQLAFLALRTLFVDAAGDSGGPVAQGQSTAAGDASDKPEAGPSVSAD